MSNNDVSYDQLSEFLEGLGFTRKRVPGSHVYYRHDPSGALIFVRDYRPGETVDAVNLAGVRATLDGFGVMSREEFNARMNGAIPTASSW